MEMCSFICEQKEKWVGERSCLTQSFLNESFFLNYLLHKCKYINKSIIEFNFTKALKHLIQA